MKSVLVLCVLFVVPAFLGYASANCPDLWTQFQGSCYYFFEEHKNWVQANQVCRFQNGHLVTINTKEENAFIESVARKRQENVWIGASDSMMEGVFRWVENNEVLSFTDWYHGQPDNWNGEENCLALGKTMSFHWNDAVCDVKLYYICEITPETPVIG